jgi:hypothetical protein
MSIRTRLILIALLATLLVSLVIGWRFVQDRDRAVSTAMQQLPALASSMANAVGERVQGTEQLFFGLARSQGLDTRDAAGGGGPAHRWRWRTTSTTCSPWCWAMPTCWWSA